MKIPFFDGETRETGRYRPKHSLFEIISAIEMLKISDKETVKIKYNICETTLKRWQIQYGGFIPRKNLKYKKIHTRIISCGCGFSAMYSCLRCPVCSEKWR